MTYQQNYGWRGQPANEAELAALIAHGRELHARALGHAIGGLAKRVRNLIR